MLQSGVTGSGPLALLVTALLAVVFYAVTLHLAAVFFIGEVPSQLAAKAAPVPAAVSLLLQQYGAAVVIPMTLLGDLVAVSVVYRLRLRSAVILVLLHFAFAATLGLALRNLLA